MQMIQANGGFNALDALGGLLGLGKGVGGLVDDLATALTGSDLVGDLAGAGVNLLTGNVPGAVASGLELVGDGLEKARSLAAQAPSVTVTVRFGSAADAASTCPPPAGHPARASAGAGAHGPEGAHRGRPADAAGGTAPHGHPAVGAGSAAVDEARHASNLDGGGGWAPFEVSFGLPPLLAPFVDMLGLFGIHVGGAGHRAEPTHDAERTGGTHEATPRGHAAEPRAEAGAAGKLRDILDDPSLSLEEKVSLLLNSLVDGLDDDIKDKMDQIDGAGADDKQQLANELQMLMNKRTEMMGLLSNTLASLHQASMQVIGNIR